MKKLLFVIVLFAFASSCNKEKDYRCKCCCYGKNYTDTAFLTVRGYNAGDALTLCESDNAGNISGSKCEIY